MIVEDNGREVGVSGSGINDSDDGSDAIDSDDEPDEFDSAGEAIVGVTIGGGRDECKIVL